MADEPRTFERLLSDPDEQFDKRSELLASIEAYSKAVPATASGPVVTDDREPFREARAAGLRKRHEQRLARAREREATDICWLCQGLGGVAPHLKWSAERGKPLWTAHEHPSDDPHPTHPCPACSAAALLTAAEAKVLTEAALRLGRREAGEEIAGLIEEESAQLYYGNRHHLHEAADVARQYARDAAKGDPA